MKKILYTVLLVSASVSAFAQTSKTKTKVAPKGTIAPAPLDRSVRPKAAPAPTINIKDSEVFTLENGITVILSENHKLPRVSLNLVMGSDPFMEGAKAGVADMASELIMAGTTNRSKDDLDKEIDYIGASINAGSESIMLSCLTKHLPKAMELYSDVIFNANFPQSEFDRVKKQSESNLLSSKSSPDAMASNAEQAVNFKNHPYGEVMTEASLAAITRDDIVSYYKKMFTPNGSYLVIVGDIKKDEAIKLANTYLGAWKGGMKSEMDYGKGTFNQGTKVFFVKKAGAVQSKVAVSFPVDMKPGDMNQVPLSVLNTLLGGGGFGARLMQNLREDKAYTYGCYSNLNITDNGSWFSAGGNFRNEVTDSAITEILYEIKRIITEEVTDDELNQIKASMAGSFARSLESPNTIARFALNIIQNNLPKDYYQTYLKRLEAVDKATILKMAQKYLSATNCSIVIVGSESVIDRVKKFDSDGKIEFLDAFGQPVSNEVKKADITKDQLIEKYVLALTQTTSMKAAKKKISKVKSMKQVLELTNPQFPGAMEMTNFFVAPNKEAMSVNMMGMTVNKEYFDGTKGGSMNMQTGKKEMTADEIASKKKSVGLIPEMNYATAGMTYELLGMEMVKDKECYVMKTNDGQSEKMDYYDVKTLMKVQTVVTKDGEGSTIVYSDFKDVNGILYPHAMNMTFGEMILSGTTKALEINGKIEALVFQ